MYAKLKSRVNKLYGTNIWQGLSKHDKDMLRSIGAHKVWKMYNDKESKGEYKTISRVIDWAESAKAFKEIDAENLHMVKEMEPIVFETMAQINEDELDITPSGEVLLKKLFPGEGVNENQSESKQSM